MRARNKGSIAPYSSTLNKHLTLVVWGVPLRGSFLCNSQLGFKWTFYVLGIPIGALEV